MNFLNEFCGYTSKYSIIDNDKLLNDLKNIYFENIYIKFNDVEICISRGKPKIYRKLKKIFGNIITEKYQNCGNLVDNINGKGYEYTFKATNYILKDKNKILKRIDEIKSYWNSWVDEYNKTKLIDLNNNDSYIYCMNECCKNLAINLLNENIDNFK